MLQDTEQPFASAVSGARDHLAGGNRFTYRFDDVQVDTAKGCVRKSGQDQYIRQQSFQVLIYLIERRERLVGKEELIENFWRHTAVTDNALVQCIADVRKALGDDSRHPRFIKTVPKVGYRFIGAVYEHPRETTLPLRLEEPILQPSVQRDSLTPHRGAPDAPPAASANRRRRAGIAIAAGLLAVLAICYLALHRSSAARLEFTLPPVPGKKPLAVMYFENQSKRADLNWLREGLADMFIADLTHSDKLTVLSRQQLALLLERGGHQPASEIRLDEALDIARRSRAEAVLLGSFAALGERLLINVQLFESNSGRLLAADRFTVSRPADILAQVDLLSLKLVTYLGLSPPESPKARLSGVMTTNFEAYRYYSLGVSKAEYFENAEAVSLLQKAVQRDPSFAMAYARIGYAYSVTDFLPEKGRPYLEKAFQLSERLTEKDRLYVAAWYAIAREDYLSAIRTLRQIVAQYPLEIEAYARLARLLFREEQPQEAIFVVQQGLATDPGAPDLYNVLGICFLGLNRYREAVAAHERYVQLSPKEPNAHDSLGMSYQQSGQYAEAKAEYTTALSLKADFEPSIIHLADLYAQQGRYRPAIREYRRYIQVTKSDAARAVAYGSIAQVCWRKRDFHAGEKAAQDETRYNPGAVWNSLLFALHRGDAARAARFKEKLFENSPYPERGVRHELRSYDYYLGVLALRNKQSGDAVDYFKQALRHLPPSSGLDLYEDCLANALFELGDLDGAQREYERILTLNPNYPLLQYHLAKTYERKGQLDQARVAYRRFLSIWNDADVDIPEILDARSTLRESSSKAP